MRGVKGSGKAKATANGKVAGTLPKNPKWAKAAVDADEDGGDAATAGSAFPESRSGEAAVCRQDGTVLEAGRCPACARRAQRFAKLVELERAQNVCASCGPPAARLGPGEHSAAITATWLMLLAWQRGERDDEYARRRLWWLVRKVNVPPASVTEGMALIATERERQKAVEGWTEAHDDKHTTGDLARAAACYASPGPRFVNVQGYRPPAGWPWEPEWWRPTPHDRVRELVKAGALILAEIERVQRLRATEGPGNV